MTTQLSSQDSGSVCDIAFFGPGLFVVRKREPPCSVSCAGLYFRADLLGPTHFSGQAT